jgi:hypothetical protein
MLSVSTPISTSYIYIYMLDCYLSIIPVSLVALLCFLVQIESAFKNWSYLMFFASDIKYVYVLTLLKNGRRCRR